MDDPRWRTGPARIRSHRVKLRNFLPIWSCSVWGLPCLRRYRRSGALLPHLFTLTQRPKAEGGMFSVALAVLRPSRRNPGRYPAHCPAEFGLSSPVFASAVRQRPPGTPAYLNHSANPVYSIASAVTAICIRPLPPGISSDPSVVGLPSSSATVPSIDVCRITGS